MPLVTIVNDELKTSDLFWDLIRVKVINSLTEISYIVFAKYWISANGKQVLLMTNAFGYFGQNQSNRISYFHLRINGKTLSCIHKYLITFQLKPDLQTSHHPNHFA